mmetsp:Transcript_41601/g.72410  ORF Transcript_41601/g.72410 Transcript_41601/m.72410 type:complete len:343 (+) Transcript_41601:348-1376(+)
MKFVNRVVFQPPAPPSYGPESFPGDLMILNGVVCLGFPNPNPASNLLIHFHGNAEDLGLINPMMQKMRDQLNVHVLAVEYPGYGLMEGKPGTKAINKCAFQVYRFVTEKLNWPSQKIILCGYSIGTGPAAKLAAEHPVGALLMVAPYRSLKRVASHHMGCFGKAMVSSRWKNEASLASVTCPTLIFHGQDDKLIPPKHAERLYRASAAAAKTLHLAPGCGHSRIDRAALVAAVRGFLREFVQLGPGGADADGFARALVLHQGFEQRLPARAGRHAPGPAALPRRLTRPWRQRAPLGLVVPPLPARGQSKGCGRRKPLPQGGVEKGNGEERQFSNVFDPRCIL